MFFICLKVSKSIKTKENEQEFILIGNISTWNNILIIILMWPMLCHHAPVSCILFESHFVLDMAHCGYTIGAWVLKVDCEVHVVEKR